MWRCERGQFGPFDFAQGFACGFTPALRLRSGQSGGLLRSWLVFGPAEAVPFRLGVGLGVGRERSRSSRDAHS